LLEDLLYINLECLILLWLFLGPECALRLQDTLNTIDLALNACGFFGNNIEHGRALQTYACGFSHLLSKMKGLIQLTEFATLISTFSREVICTNQLFSCSSRDLDVEKTLQYRLKRMKKLIIPTILK